MINFIIEWDGESSEDLNKLLEKSQKHASPQAGSLNSHLISMRKSSSISEVIALWMGYPGVPDSIKSNVIFITVLSITTLALLLPRQLKMIPDSAGDILKVFEMKGFHRTISKKKLLNVIEDPLVVDDGIKFLLDRKLVDCVDDDSYRLLEVPLTNIKINLL